MPAQLDRTPLAFSLSSTPLAATERTRFAEDLAGLGFDDGLLTLLDGALDTGTRDVQPRLLRAHRGGQLVFAAHVHLCRRMMRTFFPNRVGAVLDVVPATVAYWSRFDPGVDHCGSPGFVAPGEHRDTLVGAAIQWLARRAVSVSVAELASDPEHGAAVTMPFVDSGYATVTPTLAADCLAAHRHLRRKLARFRNHGGTITCCRGPVPDAERAAMLRCLACAEEASLVRIPVQDNYAQLVQRAFRLDSPELLHLMAHLERELVGYHTFAVVGDALLCLSGAFDRTRQTTYHAYEVLLLEAMQVAMARGLRRICFGPILNPTKLAMVPETAPLVVRAYSRWAVVRESLRWMVPRSAMRAERFAPYQRSPVRS